MPLGEGPESEQDAPPARRLRIGIFSFTSAEFDSRSLRIARSAVAAGHEVTIYARRRRDLPREEFVDGYRIARHLSPMALLLPWGRKERLRHRAVVAEAGLGKTNPSQPGKGRKTTGKAGVKGKANRRAGAGPAGRARAGTGAAGRLRQNPTARLLLGPVARVIRPVRRRVKRGARRLLKPFRLFPLLPMAWSIRLADVVEPADIWHGMWGSSLPALERVRAQHGGKTIYDCRDILLRSGAFERMPGVRRRVLMRIERHWARSCDTIISVNDAYADIVKGLFGTERPAVVMNCPERWQPPTPRSNRIREALGIPATTSVVLYQGGMKPDRGIEESLAAVLQVPNACLVLLGYGPSRELYREMAAMEQNRGHLYVLDAVPPTELLEWSASADVMLMAIPNTSLNHRHTTPQKLFEALAAGVPVVASDMPGMARIVRTTGCGELCDPASPASIAAGLRRILEAPPEERAAYGRRALEAAHTTYNWEAQLEVLSGVYARLLS